MRSVGVVLGLCALAGCVPAQMQLPAALAAAERTEFIGIDGWTRGQFTAGPYAGDYRRSATRLSFLDPLTESRGGSLFTLTGPSLEPIEGRCRMSETSLDFGVIEVTTRPLAYRCEFSGSVGTSPAWLELQEFNGPGAAINRYERRGAIAFAGQTVQIRSSHALSGTRVPTSTPIGYTFEQGGRPVGAVELNGRPVLSVVPGASPALRQALTLAALALGVFWDPANLDT